MNRLFTILLLLFCISTPLTCKVLESTDMLRSQTSVEHFLYESYMGNNLSLEGVLSYQRDFYAAPPYFFSIIVHGATTGIRGGYGIGAVGFGRHFSLSPRLYGDWRLFIGSGGGKGIPAAGGLVMGVQSGIGYHLTKHLAIESRLGYISFVTGTYSVPTVHMGLSYHYNFLVVQPK